MAEKKAVAWLGRSQLYSLAAVSSYGHDTLLAISIDKFDPDTGDVIVAVRMRDNVAPQQLMYRHDNGFAYYQINRAGVIKPLKEGEI